MASLLLIEDDLELGGMMQGFLNRENYEVDWIDDGSKAIEHIRRYRSHPADLVVLDVMLPGSDGLIVCGEIRRYSNAPVLMLTACDDDKIEISSLDIGADGYLVKPVRPHVLLAHIRSLLRRTSADVVQKASDQFHVQDIKFDPRTREAQLAGQNLSLTDAELELLLYLMRHPGEIVSRDRLCQTLRGLEYDGQDRSIDMRISSLRRKMGDNTPPFRYIKTIRGKGYLLIR